MFEITAIYKGKGRVGGGRVVLFQIYNDPQGLMHSQVGLLEGGSIMRALVSSEDASTAEIII